MPRRTHQSKVAIPSYQSSDCMRLRLQHCFLWLKNRLRSSFLAITILRFEVVDASMTDLAESSRLEVKHRKTAACIDDGQAAA